MGRKDDHPSLKAIGVYAADTQGNGNCLFHALSDQLYGDQSKHVQLRDAVIQYMTANSEHFKSFLAVHPGGGQRRNPKRKNAGAFSAQSNAAAPTADDVEATFQRYLKTMAQGGSYGDNMEIVAFASSFCVNVWIFGEQHGEFYTVAPPKDGGEVTRTVYIVHHAYEHYSSIRNIAGPHQGLPNVHIVQPSAQAEATMKAELASYSYVKEWMVEDALRSLPYETDRAVVEQALQEAKGNVNEAVTNLLPYSSQSSVKTSGTSSPASIERDDDDGDFEMEQKPKKKQDRRQSRPHPLKNQHLLTVRTKEASMLSPNPTQLSAALIKLKDIKAVDPDETEEEDWRKESAFKDSESASGSTSVSDYSTNSKGEAGPVRLKLSQPKKQPNKPCPVSTNSSNQSIAGEYDADAEKSQLARKIAKPRRRLISGNERLAAQKAARLSNTALHTTTKKQNQSTPVIDIGIKVLSI
ncbi:OTU domain-containing protein 3, partial [Lecanoromycetidae sp. Uapishka_2]